MNRWRFVLFVVLVLIPFSGFTQDLTGRYEVQGLNEQVSVLKLNDDSTFNFQYIHGAAERYANGYWTDINGILTLNSPEKEQPDFILIESRTSGSGKVTVKISDPNKKVLPLVSITIKGKKTNEVKRAGADGEVVFNETDVDSIFLQHEIWTNERVAIPLTDKKWNYFEFSINPEITNIVFKDVMLKVDGVNLKGMHPLVKGVYSYIKVK